MPDNATREALLRKIVQQEQEIERLQRSEEKLHAFAAALEQNNRHLQDFVYITAHDLQEPLNLIQAFGERLHTRYGDALSDHGRRYLKRIENTAVRMKNLIEGLLMYSRVTGEAQSFTIVDLTTVIHEVLADLEVRIERTGARIKLGKLPALIADPLQMRQLFQNLLGNALKFRHKGRPPLIIISTASQRASAPGTDGPEYCRICVKDNGIGFEKKYQHRIFSIFQRLHNRTQYEGTGIGLTICKMIVERHDGSIHAEGRPGRGATFIISLPVSRLASQANPPGQCETEESPAEDHTIPAF
jgi:light-regulated signal transduction histidine kinase (bacteriophytochrome)